jgi:hypothetical protein
LPGFLRPVPGFFLPYIFLPPFEIRDENDVLFIYAPSVELQRLKCHNLGIRKDLKMEIEDQEQYFFDIGVRLYRMLEAELAVHGIEGPVSLKNDVEIDNIIEHIKINLLPGQP